MALPKYFYVKRDYERQTSFYSLATSVVTGCQSSFFVSLQLQNGLYRRPTVFQSATSAS